MKKWIILFFVVAVVGGAWWYLRTYVRFTPSWDKPKFGEITRGDIRVPIAAAGLIEPDQRIEVKSKASGEVIDIPVVEGRFVKKGDALLVLKKDDEQRLVDRASAELDRAKAMEATAHVNVKRAEASIIIAEARVEEIAAQAEMTRFELEKVEDYHERGIEYSAQQLNDARARHKITLAQQKSAKASLTNARNALEEAKQNVKLQEAAVKIASKSLEDAEERLSETTVITKHDAIVTQVLVERGMLIQSGTTSLMGGTPVMFLADVSKKKVVARVDEADYGRVLRISPVDAMPEMPGLQESAAAQAEELEQRSGIVKLMLDAFPDMEFEGRIERVEPQGRLNAGSSVIQFDVHVAVTDPQGNMLPLGAQAQVEFTVESAEGVLRVPAESVMTFQDQRGVWVRTPPKKGARTEYGRKFIPCRFGITDGAYTELISVQGGAELKEGLEVYTKLPTERDNADEEQ